MKFHHGLIVAALFFALGFFFDSLIPYDSNEAIEVYQDSITRLNTELEESKIIRADYQYSIDSLEVITSQRMDEVGTILHNIELSKYESQVIINEVPLWNDSIRDDFWNCFKPMD